MGYQQFAYVYDYLMADAPYMNWLEFLKEETKKNNFKCRKKVLDLACGTGEFSLLLAKNGYQVTGVDLSEDMLMVAMNKAKKNELDIDFFQQDMTQLTDLGTFDIATIFCDSLNYLATPKEVKQTFKHIYQHLDDNGLLLFDVHSPFKMENIYKYATFALADEEVSYIWDSFPGEYPHSVEHELTFFVEDQNGKYDRFEELHKQRTYVISDYELFLAEAGFSILSITADFTGLFPGPEAERIFFVCQKS